MVNSLSPCPGTTDKVCSPLPSGSDPHLLCISCRGKKCNIDDRCSNCHDWNYEMWQVSSYCPKLAIQVKRKKERKGERCLFFFFLWFLPFYACSLCELSSLLESVIATPVPSTSSSSSSLVSTPSPVAPAQPFVSRNVPFASEVSRKRRKEDSSAVLISRRDADIILEVLM